MLEGRLWLHFLLLHPPHFSDEKTEGQRQREPCIGHLHQRLSPTMPWKPEEQPPAWVMSSTSTTYNSLLGFRPPGLPAPDRSFFSLRTGPKALDTASPRLIKHQSQTARVIPAGLGPVNVSSGQSSLGAGGGGRRERQMDGRKS